MRLSLLLEREPFGDILERTLSRFWSEKYGDDFTVKWGAAVEGGQHWRGNPYLNYFGVDDVDPRCFDVIRKEYSYSRRPWLRPVQSAYVFLALLRPVRRYCSRLSFAVTPPVPDAAGQLVIPGNHRLRILQPSLGEVEVLHKVGFPPESFQRELRARQGAAKTVAPRLLKVDTDERWFTESYFAGTPANRLPPTQQAQVRSEAARMLDEQVHQATLRQQPLREYSESLVSRITEHAPSLGESLDVILAALSRGGVQLDMVRSHGDFQDGNILFSLDEGVRIIDWEFSQERSRIYDLATMLSGIRLAGDWIECWQKTALAWMQQPDVWRDVLPASPVCSRELVLVWLLEETLLRAEQMVMRPQEQVVDYMAPLTMSFGVAVKVVV